MNQARQSPWGGGQFWSSFPVALAAPIRFAEFFLPLRKSACPKPEFFQSVDAKTRGFFTPGMHSRAAS